MRQIFQNQTLLQALFGAIHSLDTPCLLVVVAIARPHFRILLSGLHWSRRTEFGRSRRQCRPHNTHQELECVAGPRLWLFRSVIGRVSFRPVRRWSRCVVKRVTFSFAHITSTPKNIYQTVEPLQHFYAGGVDGSVHDLPPPGNVLHTSRPSAISFSICWIRCSLACRPCVSHCLISCKNDALILMIATLMHTPRPMHPKHTMIIPVPDMFLP